MGILQKICALLTPKPEVKVFAAEPVIKKKPVACKKPTAKKVVAKKVVAKKVAVKKPAAKKVVAKKK